MVTSASGVFCFVRNSCDPDGVMFRANGGGAGEPGRRGDSPETFSGARGAEGDDAIGRPAAAATDGWRRKCRRSRSLATSTH